MSGQRPVLSVVFPCYRRQADAQETLSILRHAVSLPYEVIVVDNSPEPLEFQLQGQERVIVSGSNLGAAARNLGAREAQGDFVLQLDDDSHPLPGSLELAVRELAEAAPDIGGLTSQVVKPDRSLECTPLLPTVFHGCGTLFRRAALEAVGDLYPADFLFYGEEYWSTLLLLSHGFTLKHLDAFRVCHRFSESGRSRERIINRLALNNRRTWPDFVPLNLLDSVMEQTSRRYELVAAKEGVPDAYVQAMEERLQPCTRELRRLSLDEFAAYSLLDRFNALVEGGRLKRRQPVLLCGCGKFPILWAEELERLKISETLLTDFNPGIAGQEYCGRKVLPLEEALALAGAGKVQPVFGHCSFGDSVKWADALRKAGAKGVRISP